MRKLIKGKPLLCLVIAGLLVLTGGLFAAPNVSAALHPNLAAAQGFIENALEKLTAAQKANDYDMDGHVAKAKTLLDQAFAEIKAGALAANAKK